MGLLHHSTDMREVVTRTGLLLPSPLFGYFTRPLAVALLLHGNVSIT